MKGFAGDIEKLTKNNNDYRQVIYTGQNSQLVLMSIKPGEEIGMEVLPDNDQFIRVEDGKGRAVIDGNEFAIEDNWAVLVPAGAQHNIINNGDKDLKIYTIYSPPHHRDKVVHRTKEEADRDDEEFDGTTTEESSQEESDVC